MRTRTLLLSSVLLAACSRTESPAATAAPVQAEAPLVKAAAEPPSPKVEDNTFRLALVGPAEYTAGQAGSLKLTLEALGGYHVNQDYPIRVDVKAPPEVKLEKVSLGKADAAQFGEQQARFELPFSASAGAHDLTATVDFAVCTKETCVPDTRTVALALQAR